MKHSEEKIRRAGEKDLAPLRTRVLPGGILSYAVPALILLALADFFRSDLLLALLILTLLLPVFSIWTCFLLRRELSLSLSLPGGTFSLDDRGFLLLKVHDPTLFSSLEVQVHLVGENSLYPGKRAFLIDLSCRPKGETEGRIPLSFAALGNAILTVDSFTVRDLLGLIVLSKRVDLSTEATVLPKDGPVPFDPGRDFRPGTEESRESEKKGNDFSDVSEIREYIPGDRLLSIHWKLSAKVGKLMVKDRTQMSDSEVLILIDIPSDGADVTDILTFTYRFLIRGIRGESAVRLIWYAVKAEAFREAALKDREDIDTAFREVYYDIPGNKKDLPALMQIVRPEVSSYVRISYKEEGPYAEVVDQ